MSNNDDIIGSLSGDELIYDNFSPSDEDLKNFAYSTRYKFVEQDWEICAVDYQQRHLYLEFASDPQCPFCGLFTNMLFVLAASLVYDVRSLRAGIESQEGELVELPPLARNSQAFPSRAGQESVKYESAQFLSGDGELKHIEVDKNDQTRSLPAIGSRSRNKLEKCGLAPDREPLPAEVREKLLVLLKELEPVSKSEIVLLRKSIRDCLLEDDSKFEYDFWFNSCWKEHLS